LTWGYLVSLGWGVRLIFYFIFGGFGHKVEATVELVERVEKVELVELVGCWHATVSSLLLLGFFMSRLWGFIGGVFMVCISIVFFCFSAGCLFRGL
jgi:hypothetical protein